MNGMRGSDLVDFVFEIAPRPLVRVLLGIVAVLVLVFDYTEPIEWYIQDKAAATADLLEEALATVLGDLAPTVPHEAPISTEVATGSSS